VQADGSGRTSLLQYLPAIYAEDPFMHQFLRIFEAIWAPLDRQVDQLHAYFSPQLTPPELLPWLGGWLDLVLDENWPEARRRALIARAADLYARRGTAGALRDYLHLYLGVAPQIQEDDQEPFHFSVVLRLDDPEAVDQDRLRKIIDEEKPAHTTYTLRLEKR
jgi:phage tail-like protein